MLENKEILVKGAKKTRHKGGGVFLLVFFFFLVWKMKWKYPYIEPVGLMKRCVVFLKYV